jgi:glutathione S-transferase
LGSTRRLLDFLQHRALLPEFARDASYAERDELLLRKPLEVLNEALRGRDHLVGGDFTVADLNVASILVWGKMARLDPVTSSRRSTMAGQLFGAACVQSGT